MFSKAFEITILVLCTLQSFQAHPLVVLKRTSCLSMEISAKITAATTEMIAKLDALRAQLCFDEAEIDKEIQEALAKSKADFDKVREAIKKFEDSIAERNHSCLTVEEQACIDKARADLADLKACLAKALTDCGCLENALRIRQQMRTEIEALVDDGCEILGDKERCNARNFKDQQCNLDCVINAMKSWQEKLDATRERVNQYMKIIREEIKKMVECSACRSKDLLIRVTMAHENFDKCWNACPKHAPAPPAK